MNNQFIKFKDQSFPISKKISQGRTADIYEISEERIIKVYRKEFSNTTHFDREVFWLKALENSGIVPKLLDIDTKKSALMMENAGSPFMDIKTLPEYWKQQCKYIQEVLNQNNCSHNDISEQEILVKHDKLRICDFGIACLKQKPNDPNKEYLMQFSKARIFEDKYIINFLEYIKFGASTQTEPHCFVLWQINEREKVEELLNKRFRVIRCIRYEPSFFKKIGLNREKVLNRFYSGRSSKHGQKGYQSFILYFVLDEAPNYEVRENPFRGEKTIVNTNTFEIKNYLRSGRNSFLHASDSIQEAYDNLEALSLYGKPLSYWYRWRPQFNSLSELFDSLNKNPNLYYVVLRNFDVLTQNNNLEFSSDIDFLVNNYYLFKRLTGAISYKHKLSPTNNSFGPAYEYGGYKVAAKINVAGKEVSVDIRFLGDQYYCEEWEKNILHNRQPYGDFYIPDKENFFYSLMYHALVHKRNLREDYRMILSELAKELNVIPNLGGDQKLDKEQLWYLLDTYMEKQGYTYVRPIELSIPFNAREKAGISIETDLKNAEIAFNQKELAKARDLLYLILADAPNHQQANNLIKKTQSALESKLSWIELSKNLASQWLPEPVKYLIKKYLNYFFKKSK